VADASLWTDWYLRASTEQQQEALRRAVQDGILYAHQLAAPAHSTALPRSPLANLLNGQVKELEPLRAPLVACHDGELDAWQREAVARAVATPDVCLIQGFPGTGKSRLIVEIILQATQRGERVLFLAPTSAALDRVLERLGTQAKVCPLRCLAVDEALTSLPAAVARLTLPERLRWYRETTLPAARAACDAARRTRDACSRQQAQWMQLEELARQRERLGERLRTLSARRAEVAAEVERGEQTSSVFGEQRQECERTRTETLERLDSQLAGLHAELETIAGKQAHLDSEWETLRPLAEARQGGRFWSGAWWRAMRHGGLNERVRELEARRLEMQTARQRLDQDIAARRSERAEAEKRHADDIRRLQDEEIARRQSALDVEIAAVTRERVAVEEQGKTHCSGLAAEEVPAELSRQAVASARAVWERRRQLCDRQVASAEQWFQTVEEGQRFLPEKLAGCANVVAATTTALPRDAHFGDRDGTPTDLFDLLILEEAHQVTESEFAAAARRARRWVMIGEPRCDAEVATTSAKPSRAALLRPGFFERLWQSLHADPHRLPCVWKQRDGRLLCRLRPLPTEQEKWIESEAVVDRPDIELRILSLPRQTSRIVEVLFPAGMGIEEAKQFLFHELEELAVQTRGRELNWLEAADEVVLQLAALDEADTVTVALENGVRERVARLPSSGTRDAEEESGWHTCGVEFARSAGWTRERAEQWIAERLGLRCTGRTVLLAVPHRLDAPLARFLSDLLFNGLCQPTKTPAKVSLSRPAVEFVAVPALASVEGRSRSESSGRNRANDPVSGSVAVRAPRLRSVKGGAGLELDLSETRPLEQLPSELRALLPRQGLVNYLEACAVVKRLQALLDDESFRSACEQWRQRRSWPCQHGCLSPSACGCPATDNGPAVAVMALYPAQVELLRQLMRRTPALIDAPIAIEVGPPSAFHQRECLLALLSLTRSHTHRAVSYGDHPHTLAQALTRAAGGLILFGDPGTLARRSQWHGPLDHLDDSAARREGGLIGQLVHYLQGHGTHPSAFHVHEGSSV
jgi:hypothetical protein